RLPTEAEWEYACRGGVTSEEECSYFFYIDKPTNELSSEQANWNGSVPISFEKGIALKGPYMERPTRVGAYPSNKLGLCDMHGSVWQWSQNVLQGSAPRVARGGRWSEPGSNCRAAVRFRYPPTDRSPGRGFRLARVSRPVPDK